MAQGVAKSDADAQRGEDDTLKGSIDGFPIEDGRHESCAEIGQRMRGPEYEHGCVNQT